MSRSRRKSKPKPRVPAKRPKVALASFAGPALVVASALAGFAAGYSAAPRPAVAGRQAQSFGDVVDMVAGSPVVAAGHDGPGADDKDHAGPARSRPKGGARAPSRGGAAAFLKARARAQGWLVKPAAHLAAETAIPADTLKRILAGEREPCAKHFATLARVYGDEFLASV